MVYIASLNNNFSHFLFFVDFFKKLTVPHGELWSCASHCHLLFTLWLFPSRQISISLLLLWCVCVCVCFYVDGLMICVFIFGRPHHIQKVVFHSFFSHPLVLAVSRPFFCNVPCVSEWLIWRPHLGTSIQGHLLSTLEHSRSLTLNTRDIYESLL